MLNHVNVDEIGKATCIWHKFDDVTGTKALLDTGARISLLPKKLYETVAKKQTSKLEKSDIQITGANKADIQCYGKVNLKFKIEDKEFENDFYVCENDVNVLVGNEFMAKADLSTRPAKNKIYLGAK